MPKTQFKPKSEALCSLHPAPRSLPTSKEDFPKTLVVPVEHKAAEIPRCSASPCSVRSLFHGPKAWGRENTLQFPEAPGLRGRPLPLAETQTHQPKLERGGAGRGPGRGGAGPGTGQGGAAASARAARGPGAARSKGSACGRTSPGHG